jgi:hypothetical protein
VNIYVAVKKNCTECSGSAQESVLCQIRACDLWPYRLGTRMATKGYRSRVEAAWANGGEAVKEAQLIGLGLADFLQDPTPVGSKKDKRPFPKALARVRPGSPEKGPFQAGAPE